MVSAVTSFNDMAPSPRAVVDIDVNDLDPNTRTITVFQVSQWGQVAVRNATRKSAVGGFLVTDYELPPGVPVTYRVEQFDVTGSSLGFALSLDAMVEIPFGMIVVQDPLAPAGALLLNAEAQFAEQLTRTRPSARYQAGGRTFAMTGLYSALQAVSLRCTTETEAERAGLATLLESPLLLIRSMPKMRLPGAFFASIDSVPMIPVNARGGGDIDLWDLAADEVTRPDLEIIVAVYTYDRYKAYLDAKYPPFGTYDDARAEWATYLDAMRNPPPEV